MAQICSGQTSYTNPNAILNVSGDAVRVSANTVRINVNWSIYTAGSSLDVAPRILRLVDGNNNSLGQFDINDSWEYNTWYSGSGSINVGVGAAAGNLYVGCMVLKPDGNGRTTLTWDGTKGTNTGNPAIQRVYLSYGSGDLSKPIIHRVWVDDCDWKNSHAIFAYITGTGNVSGQVGVWTEVNGQDDTEWIEMSAGSWVRGGQTYNYATTVYRFRHNYEYGRYYHNVYGYNENGNNVTQISFYWTTNVRFNGNGGADGIAKNVNLGMTYGMLPASTRAGYMFKGWFTAPAGGTQITNSSTMGSDYYRVGVQNLYAQWMANSYILTYNGNGGTTPASKNITYDLAYGTLATSARTGYTFKGWFTAASGGTQVTAGSICKGNATVYAQWTANTYTLSYDAAGGYVTPVSKSITYNSVVGTLPRPVKKGYRFLGWFTEAMGGNQIRATDVYRTAGNLILYAQWEFSATRNDLVPIKITAGKIKLAKPYIGNGTDWNGAAPKIGDGAGFIETKANPADFE